MNNNHYYNNLEDYIVSTDRSVKELITVPKNYSVELSGVHTTVVSILALAQQLGSTVFFNLFWRTAGQSPPYLVFLGLVIEVYCKE